MQLLSKLKFISEFGFVLSVRIWHEREGRVRDTLNVKSTVIVVVRTRYTVNCCTMQATLFFAYDDELIEINLYEYILYKMIGSADDSASSRQNTYIIGVVNT